MGILSDCGRPIARRRDALLEATARILLTDCRWTVPGGGFFLGCSCLKAATAVRCSHSWEQAGVSYVPGTRFCTGGGGERHLRLAFSLLSAAELAQGARRLGRSDPQRGLVCTIR